MLHDNGLNDGVAAVILNDESRYTGHVVMLGLERWGRYSGAYNLPSGNLESYDNGCYLIALIRELREEFKIDLHKWNDFDKCFRRWNDSFKIVYKTGPNNKTTPIFIGVIERLTRSTQNAIIERELHDNSLPDTYKEIIHVDYFHLNTKKQMDNRDCRISSFASSVLDMVHIL